MLHTTQNGKQGLVSFRAVTLSAVEGVVEKSIRASDFSHSCCLVQNEQMFFS